MPSTPSSLKPIVTTKLNVVDPSNHDNVVSLDYTGLTGLNSSSTAANALLEFMAPAEEDWDGPIWGNPTRFDGVAQSTVERTVFIAVPGAGVAHPPTTTWTFTYGSNDPAGGELAFDDLDASANDFLIVSLNLTPGSIITKLGAVMWADNASQVGAQIILQERTEGSLSAWTTLHTIVLEGSDGNETYTHEQETLNDGEDPPVAEPVTVAAGKSYRVLVSTADLDTAASEILRIASISVTLSAVNL